MIDTIKFQAPESKALRNAVLAKHKDNPAINYRYILEKVKTRFGSFTIKIFLSEGYMRMELSPAKHLQGHNVFGTNRLSKLLYGVMRLIYAHFDVQYSKREHAIYKQQGFTILRIDLTASFLVGSQAKVVNTLNLLRQHLLILGHDVVVHVTPEGIETIYIGKSSSRSSVKFYNKYLELLDKNKGKGKAATAIKALPYYADVLSYAEKVVRFEYTIRAQELRRLELDSSLTWSGSMVSELLEGKLCKLGLSAQLIAELPAEIVSYLNEVKRNIYVRWAEGDELRKILHPATFTRDRKFFLIHGLDIARTHAQTPKGVVLTSRLSTEKMRMTYPTRFVETGAVFR